MRLRSSGVLLHISSLPSVYGIGDLGPHAYAFVDFLKSAGQTYWQILPINPTDGINGHSPYSCFSAFAGNPLFISPDLLVMDGLIKPSHVKRVAETEQDQVDFVKVSAFKQKVFERAFKRFSDKSYNGAYELFVAEQRNWLNDFATFLVAKEVFAGECWDQWPAAFKNRQPKALADFNKKHAKKIEEVKFIQFLFFYQWHKLKTYANERGISIVGDIPIYVNFDSADVWCNRQYFKLDKDGRLKFVSGCPPDYFSKTGQRWGNPVYDWAKLKKAKYIWWVNRIKNNLSLFDCLRIDHFRGFSSFWQIPSHEKLAVFGQWVKGPGDDFFKALQKQFKTLPLIAEDLGEASSDVVKLMNQFRFPGMRVMLFGFNGDPKKNPHVPKNYPANCVAYTGTHDNNTVQGWYYQESKEHERANIKAVLDLKPNPRQLHWQMIEVLMKSKANMVIVPLVDILGLGADARMNTPATKVNNWKWRFEGKALKSSLAAKLFKVTRLSKRI
ncbi:MAG: 4-alpha-glucanotransferase [Candidatus Omnitrophica bacterium]|nr:4-alpha-glucanotransferase [Candidatus Omnitrophota bacterium]